jgi:hypothetical protein
VGEERRAYWGDLRGFSGREAEGRRQKTGVRRQESGVRRKKDKRWGSEGQGSEVRRQELEAGGRNREAVVRIQKSGARISQNQRTPLETPRNIKIAD